MKGFHVSASGAIQGHHGPLVGRVRYIADYQHFLLFPQCFQKDPFSRSLKVGIVWKRVVNPFLTQSQLNFNDSEEEASEVFTTQFRLLKTSEKMALENTVGEGEIADNQHLLLLPQCFLLYQRDNSSF